MDDLISRQAALNATSTTIKITGKENAETVYGYIKKLCDDIKALPSARQWIPCSERLPEKIGDYLVSVKRHGWNCEEHIENDIAYWDDLEGFHKAEEVLAWMPLPEPYKEDE